jgi:hypothetical protein
MLIINKELDTVRLIVTVSTEMDNPENGFRLSIHSPFTNKDYSIILPANSSLFPERFDEFLVDSDEFSEMEPGEYRYSIYEYSVEDVKLLEKGLLRVESTQEQSAGEFTFPEPTPQEDDFVIYDPSTD